MKSKQLVLLAIIILLLPRCSTMLEQSPNNVRNTTSFSIKASMEDLGVATDRTKAVATPVIRLQWQAGDKISVVNLTTGKALGGDLIAQEGGSTTTFSGSLSGTIAQGDKLGFIYPSQGYTEEKLFSDVAIDLSEQNGDVYENKFALSGSMTYEGITTGLNIPFKFLVSYVLITMADLPIGENVEEISITNVSNAVTLSINDGKSGFNVNTASNIGSICIKPQAMSTGSKGTTSFFVKLGASEANPARRVYVATESSGYVTSFPGVKINSNLFYNATVSDFEGCLYFRDPNFKAYLLENFDIDKDGSISVEEADNVVQIDVCTENITSLKGIENFKNLKFLDASADRTILPRSINGENWHSSGYYHSDGTSAFGKITELDLSKNVKLKSLCCRGNQIRCLDISNNENLQRLELSYNVDLRDIIYPKQCILKSIQLSYTSIEAIDVTGMPDLMSLQIGGYGLSAIDLSNNKNLKSLNLRNNRLSQLDVTANLLLESLRCSYNRLQTIDLSKNTLLNDFECSFNQLQILDVTNNINLENLQCTNNLFQELDVSNNVKLEILNALGNSFLKTIYYSSDQQFKYFKDNHTSFQVKESVNLYQSADYSTDGTVAALQSTVTGKGGNFIIIGDGFSDRLVANGTYASVVQKAVNAIKGIEPFTSFTNLYNIYSVTAVSKNEGYYIDGSTALGCYFREARIISGNHDVVKSYAMRAVSEEELEHSVIIVIANSTNYAGGTVMYPPKNELDCSNGNNGLSIIYMTLNESDTKFTYTLQHECGHAFGKLADEYNYYYQVGESNVADPNELRSQLEKYWSWGWYKNVDYRSDPAQVVWSRFINDSRYAADNIGVYDGALYYTSGCYRPTLNSIMNGDSDMPYNAPSREYIYCRLHKLYYGAEWAYDYETFVQQDLKNIKSLSTKSAKSENNLQHIPPIIKII